MKLNFTDKIKEIFNKLNSIKIGTSKSKSNASADMGSSQKLDKTGEIDSSTLNKANKENFFKGIVTRINEVIANKNINEIIYGYNSRAKIQKIFILSFYIVSAYSLGKVVSNFIPKMEPPEMPLTLNPPVENSSDLSRKIDVIKTANLFNATIYQDDGTGDPKKKQRDPQIDIANIICLNSKVTSSLPLKLVNTVVLQDAVKSIASVQVRNSKDFSLYREGDKIDQFAEVSKIKKKNVILKNLETGRCEYIALKDLNSPRGKFENMSIHPADSNLRPPPKLDGIDREGNKFKISKKLINEKLKDIGAILSEAKAVKVTNPDGSLSFKIVDIVPGSIYSYLDIQNGDEITEINGDKIKNINEVMNLFGTIKDVDKLNINIMRQGELKSFNYEIQK